MQNTEVWLRSVIEFIEVEVSDLAIKQAVCRESFDSMKKMEQTKGFNLEHLKKIEFVRKGKQGSWVESFGPNDLERFNRFHGGYINELGYSW